MIYPPREDSLLLAKSVKKLARGTVFDMGTGSGIQAQTAAKKKSVKSVLAVDIDPEVIRQCKKNVVNKKIKCLKSDLFTRVQKKQFDTIIFNPPYLPQELPERDIALEGGKKGYETLVRFLETVNSYLKINGQILILFSSLTNQTKVEQAIKQQLFDFVELDQLHIFFEDLFVYKITKSDLLKHIEKTGIREFTYFTRGKRSWIFKGKYRGKKCVVKVKRPDSAVNAPTKEGKMLKIVNKLGLGPRLFVAKKDFVVCEFIDGTYVEDALEKTTQAEKRRVFKQLFEQAFILDKAKLSKEEMLRPLRNAIVKPNGRIVLIDFERTHKTQKPQNVTQLCTFAAKQGIASLNKIKNIAAHYKHKPAMKRFKSLLEDIGL